MKKFLSVLLSILMIFAIAAPALATEAPVEDEPVAGLASPEKSGDKEGEDDKGIPVNNKDDMDILASPVGDGEDAALSEKATEAAKTEDEKTEDTFGLEKVKSIALTAAKSKMILEGLDNEITGKASVTKVSHSKKSGSFKAVIRSKFKYKYTCYISTSTVFGKTVGYLTDSEFETQSSVGGFFGWLFEKIQFFFIKLFGMAE